jgi:hypothetical protein
MKVKKSILMINPRSSPGGVPVQWKTIISLLTVQFSPIIMSLTRMVRNIVFFTLHYYY